MESSSSEDDFFVLSLLKKRKRKEILGPSSPEIPLIIKEQRDNRGQSVAQWDVLLVILEQHIKKKTTSFCTDLYGALCCETKWMNLTITILDFGVRFGSELSKHL